MVCYWGTWATYRTGNGNFDVSHIDPNICTHIIYSFFGVTAAGDVTYLDAYLDLEENFGKGFSFYLFCENEFSFMIFFF